ncbi:MAG: ferritin-like protein [Bacteroidota bacterium]
MIVLQSSLFDTLRQPGGLKKSLQQAVELEFSTIPPYLYALYSIKPERNREIYDLIFSVVVEEMLHMSLACNILNAIGGAPVIDRPKFIPHYPGPLPGSVENGLIVPLEKFSLDLIKNVFMMIEEPEDPLHFPVAKLATTPPKTIGQFYDAIKRKIIENGNDIFTGDPRKQLTHGFPPDQLIAVTDVDTAVAAIETIVKQGEGTRESPLDPQDELAHYYRYAEIYHGKQLIPNPTAPPDTPYDQKYLYGGDPIPFDPDGIWPTMKNPKRRDYSVDSTNPAIKKANYANTTFNYTFTSLLKSLHATFNGAPDTLASGIGLMESLREQALDIVMIDLGNGTHAGPTFQYQPTNP